MTTMNTFFGPTADDVLARYRRAKYASHTVDTLAVRLKELCKGRDALRAQHGSEIGHQQTRVAETAGELEEAEQQLERIGRSYGRLKRTLDSFWGRMGIRLRRIFSKDAPSVKKTRQRLAGLERGQKKTREKVEYATRVWTKQKRALERLTAPIEDLEFAIDYLEREKETAKRETAEQDAAINEAIHQTVRAMTPSVFRRKLPQFIGQLDSSDLMKTVFRLRTVLAESQALSHFCDTEAEEADVDTTLNTIAMAVTNGVSTGRGRGSGNVKLSGQGATRVKKSRTRTETRTDSSGRPTMRTRTETYWDHVQVKFSGTIDAGFGVEFNEWTKGTTVEALRTEADRWFRLGTKRLEESRLRETMEKLREEATALTGRIRAALESSTFVSG